MTAALRLLSAGPGATIQDGGRHGFLRYGVTGAGPMDPFAHAVANRALGNPANAAAIEVSLGGIEVTAEGAPVAVAVAGGEFAIALDGQALPPATVALVEPGAKLKLRAGQAGSWCYLAVTGGLDVPKALGSASTHTRSSLGGLDGRALTAGDRVAIAANADDGVETGLIVAPMLDRPAETIRVILGPQDDYFAQDQIAAFLAGPWRISARGDRMACFLEGPTLTHAQGFNIVSDGIAMGAIQVPGEGQPIVLMADRQPTGGYPKIATIIGPDLGRLAQARPGTALRFRAVDHAEAVAARAQEAAFLEARPLIEPLIRTRFSSEFLLGLNLIDGCVDACAPG
ncbi:biotin-dependent carboxyltransferase family protein [Bosea sp. LjRoot9]|uniref:5-oxoprolinase subunit C family protein n=1 Tax=Bosea sp. LjRoot9 TaxID=3342341 RepID=UPI003ED161AF